MQWISQEVVTLKKYQKYPTDAWYTYNDESCDYGCQITEYTYWALTSILGVKIFMEDLIK